MDKVKLFISDIDGTLTDSTVYYSMRGEELKQFSVRDGMGFQLLKDNSKVKSFLLTSNYGKIDLARANHFIKLKTIISAHCGFGNKKLILDSICDAHNCHLSEVAYIGDDVNDLDCLKAVGFPACPYDAHQKILEISNIYVTEDEGGQGAVRDFVDYLLDNDLVYKGE